MISKAVIKYVRSLELKKNRLREGLFVAEGPKVVGDIGMATAPTMIIATAEWLTKHPDAREKWPRAELLEASETELSKVSLMQHPQQIVGVFGMFDQEDSEPCGRLPNTELCLALDDIQDPGNLGTIIRVADWFGIGHIFCSKDTADMYNPKVVQATMGSIARVRLRYTDLKQFIGALPPNTPVYGTTLDGHDIYDEDLQPRGLIVMGNEGKGISPEIRKMVSRHLLIPNYPIGRQTAESLNVAIATAIVCAEFRRRKTL